MSIIQRIANVFRPVDALIESDNAVLMFNNLRDKGRSACLVFDMHKGHLVCLASVDRLAGDRGLNPAPPPNSGQVKVAFCHDGSCCFCTPKGGEA